MFLQRTNKLGHFYLRKIWFSRGFSVVRLVTSEKDWSDLVTTLPFMSEEELHTTAVIISHQVSTRLRLYCKYCVPSTGLFRISLEEVVNINKYLEI